ncbi:MAG: L-rhamnose mutarotase [Puia sp.]
MLRKSFLIQVRKGMEQEYERRHNPIWPELESIFKEHGVCNFSIFLEPSSGFLFGYLEVLDEETYRRIGDTDICKKWWKYNTEILICEKEDDMKGKELDLREVFHMG